MKSIPIRKTIRKSLGRAFFLWTADVNHNATVEYDLVLAVIGYQCLPPLHARSPDLVYSALGELAPVAAITDVR